MKSFNMAKKLVQNPGFFFNFNKNDIEMENLDTRVKKQFYLNYQDSQLFKKSSFVSNLRSIMMNEVNSNNLKFQTFSQMFTVDTPETPQNG
jgi:ABC-type branched-subunit amino acid transport system ATPase component